MGSSSGAAWPQRKLIYGFLSRVGSAYLARSLHRPRQLRLRHLQRPLRRPRRPRGFSTSKAFFPLSPPDRFRPSLAAVGAKSVMIPFLSAAVPFARSESPPSCSYSLLSFRLHCSFSFSLFVKRTSFFVSRPPGCPKYGGHEADILAFVVQPSLTPSHSRHSVNRFRESLVGHTSSLVLLSLAPCIDSGIGLLTFLSLSSSPSVLR